MADIRRNLVALDDFSVASDPPTNWARAETDDWPRLMRIHNGALKPKTGTPAGSYMYYYTPTSFSGDVEVWGDTWDLADLTEGWRMGLLANVGSTVSDGYSVRILDDWWRLNRLDNGVQTNIGDNTSGTSIGGDGELVLMRTEGDDVEVWWSGDNGANWNLEVSATDTNYRDDLYLCLGSVSDDGSGPGWGGLYGGETDEIWMPEFIRRPWEYEGVPLAL